MNVDPEKTNAIPYNTYGKIGKTSDDGKNITTLNITHNIYVIFKIKQETLFWSSIHIYSLAWLLHNATSNLDFFSKDNKYDYCDYKYNNWCNQWNYEARTVIIICIKIWE